MRELPIDANLPRILAALSERCLALVAPPGSGKTTRVPPALLRSGLLSTEHNTVIVLEPRRIAARAAATRIADEQGSSLGRDVGYQVRFERRFTEKTRLRFVTEGILTQTLLADPFLEGIGAVVLDEFHERSLNGDLALALLRQVKREVRPDLMIVVMSATLDARPVASFLDGCPVLQVEGTFYDVSLDYRPAARPASAQTIAPIVEELLSDRNDRGHILVFLPGAAEIRRVKAGLEPLAERFGALVLPLHGSLADTEQDRALRPTEERKVILSTNLAETSLTIDGVTTVIDSGLARRVHYDEERGIDRWELYRISRAAADQRAGRAGRTRSGRCIRLWSEREHRSRADFELPEIHRVDFCATVLALRSWGVADPRDFGWYEPPTPQRVEAADNLLLRLGALESGSRRISAIGNAMLELPIHPRLARLLVAARQSRRAGEGAAIAALLSVKDIRARDTFATRGRQRDRAARANAASDIFELLDLLEQAEAARFAPTLRARGIDPFAAREAVQLRNLLERGARSRRGTAEIADPDEDQAVLKWLLLAYPDRVVKRRGAAGTGVMVGGRGVRLSPESAVRDAEIYVALDARESHRDGVLEAEVSLASMVQVAWLEEFFPDRMRRNRSTSYDETRGRVVSATQLWYDDLLLREDTSATLDPEEAGTVLAGALRPRASSLFRSSDRAAQWFARLDFLTRALPEGDWPEFNDDVLSELLDEICRGKSTLAQVEAVDFVSQLESRLSFVQSRDLRECAPLALTVPSGRQIKLTYEIGRPPVLAARIQELFGWAETPRVARGRVAVVLHLLGPNNRPVQITDDLPSFWSTTYHQVRKDLRGRYPKHAWPEDPRRV